MRVNKTKTPEFLVMDNAIIPVANISHIIKPDDTVHIILKNATDIRFKTLTIADLSKMLAGGGE